MQAFGRFFPPEISVCSAKDGSYLYAWYLCSPASVEASQTHMTDLRRPR